MVWKNKNSIFKHYEALCFSAIEFAIELELPMVSANDSHSLDFYVAAVKIKVK